jgi:hypothetical protein
MEVSGQFHAPAALPPGKQTASGTHCIGGWSGLRRSGRYGEETVFPLAGIEPRLLGCPVRSAVAIPTDLTPALRLWLSPVQGTFLDGNFAVAYT